MTSTYYATENWNLRRKMVLRRANFRCEQCLASEELDVHHKTYDSFGNEPLRDLQALCRGCHYFFEHAEKNKVWFGYSKKGNPVGFFTDQKGVARFVNFEVVPVVCGDVVGFAPVKIRVGMPTKL